MSQLPRSSDVWTVIICWTDVVCCATGLLEYEQDQSTCSSLGRLYILRTFARRCFNKEDKKSTEKTFAFERTDNALCKTRHSMELSPIKAASYPMRST